MSGGCDRRSECGPDAQITWEVSASVLNVIWGELWPRLIAHWWRAGPDNFFASIPTDFDVGPISAGLLERAMSTLADQEAIRLGKTRPSTLPPGREWTETRFQRRLQRVRKYLNEPTPPGKIPMNFVAEDAYDFVLSDSGLDLFTPKQPQLDWEYFRYYSFRRTGRASLGIPAYLEGTLAFAVDSPTGPGQVLTTNGALQGINVSPGCSLAALDCLRPVETCVELLSGSKKVPRVRDRQFAFQDYLAAASAVRCWQIEGAVYRGIMVELPRVIAEIWMEKAAGFTGTKTYAQRFAVTTVPSPDVQDIFKERLETALPDPTRMEFIVVTGGANDDVMISNKGFRFPAAPSSWPGGYPDPDYILDAIADGRAGNPVFTDSKRPEGED